MSRKKTKENEEYLHEIKKKFVSFVDVNDRCCHYDLPFVNAAAEEQEEHGHMHNRQVPGCERHKHFRKQEGKRKKILDDIEADENFQKKYPCCWRLKKKCSKKKESKLNNGKLMDCCIHDFTIGLNVEFYDISNMNFPMCRDHADEHEIQQ